MQLTGEERPINPVHERRLKSVETKIRWLKKGIRRLLLKVVAICVIDTL
jgi:hypothetical protein